MQEPAHPLDQPGVYEIRATITTSGHLTDPTDDHEIDTYLRQALADRAAAEVEVELEYDPGATREYAAEKWVDDHENYWKGIDYDEY